MYQSKQIEQDYYTSKVDSLYFYVVSVYRSSGMTLDQWENLSEASKIRSLVQIYGHLTNVNEVLRTERLFSVLEFGKSPVHLENFFLLYASDVFGETMRILNNEELDVEKSLLKEIYHDMQIIQENLDSELVLARDIDKINKRWFEEIVPKFKNERVLEDYLYYVDY
ncbi:hypothetical protein LGQ02_12905 [Bacillus shivajii]|uniref:hypothetical protein n=1 Tax=Bacillus shivajii TaxID=1983719 RepID=UPI001CF9F5AC|nr:hypothetical protein [Bacillus shivajii]UCZ51760.1 hypothetical protein LGQ02_12905 [Bacillus shivajii]